MQYVDQLNTSHRWLGVPVGIKTFSVQLVNNDHTLVIPLAAAKIQFMSSQSLQSIKDWIRSRIKLALNYLDFQV